MCFCVVQKKKEKRDTKLLSCTQQLLDDKSNLYQRQSQVSLFFFISTWPISFSFFLFSFGVPASFHQNKNCSKKKIYSVVPSAWPSSTPPPPNHLCTERARRYCGHVIERSALWPFLYRVIKVFFLFFLFFCCLFSYFCVDTPVLVYTCRLPFMYHRHHFCSDSLGLIFLIEKKISFNPIRNDSNTLRCY